MPQRDPLLIWLTRWLLTRLGAHSSRKTLVWLDYWLERVMSQLEAGWWFRAHGFAFKPAYPGRRALYAALAPRFAAEQVLYLEFGVFQGASLRAWSALLTNPGSALHGFDSFAGLPERWNAYNPQGMFDTKGNVPTFDDPRIHLHVGWFDETLPPFTLPPHERLVVHLDVDLYASAHFVLETLRDAIDVGTVILFDEFYDRKHELKAFDEFLTASGQVYRFLGGATSLSQVAFERTA